MNRFPYTIIVCALFTFHCSPTKSLSESEKAKLDPPLIRLLTEENVQDTQLDSSLRSDGTIQYAVIIRSVNTEEVKALGIPVSSVFGDVIVAHVTAEELRKIVALASVRAIQVGSKNTIQ